VELSNSDWIQIGYYGINPGGITGFAQLWDLNTNSVISGFSWSISAGTHQFSMYVTTGTTWAFAMDGSVKGTYDMGTSTSGGTISSQPLEALVEQQMYNGIAAYAVPDIEFPVAFEALIGGTWIPVAVGDAWEQGAFGVEGNEQDSSLSPNQIIVGSSFPVLSQGTELWSGATGGATPTTLTLSVVPG
jgi:hypothetical protein